MIAFYENQYPESGSIGGVVYVTGTSTTNGEYLQVRLSATDWYCGKLTYVCKNKKKSKKPIVAEDPILDVPKFKPIHLFYTKPLYYNRMLFDKSGKLPNRIRKIKKQR